MSETPAEQDVVKHKCAICNYATTVLGNYKQHLKTHSNEKPFKCPECSYRAKSKSSVESHLKLVHFPESRLFPCQHPECGYAAKTKGNLNVHLKTHSDENSFVCSHPNCSFATNQKGHLKIHLRVHTDEKPFACQFQFCSYAAAQRSHLVAHTRTHTKERPFKCPEPNCKSSTTQTGNLKKHQLTHEPKEGEVRRSFSCPLCEFSTKYKSALTIHNKQKHSDDKPFVCPVESCEYRCKSKCNLSDHLKAHRKERQYKCELCPFRGKTRNTVTKHLRNVHTDPDFRPFKCTEPKCDYSAKNQKRLNLHLLTHNGEKRFSCSFPDCGYRAIERRNVKEHEYNIHSEEKKEQCLICLYKCKTKSKLTIHMRTHTKEEPYKCKEPNCEYRAKTSTSLKKHEKRNHPQISQQAL